MNRIKQWLLACGLGLAGAVGVSSYLASRPARTPEYTLEQLTEANQRLREFPEQIEGAKEIRKYEVPGARYCLVNIKQSHYSPPKTMAEVLKNEGVIERKEIITKISKSYSRVNSIQKNIYRILEALNAREVFGEGALYGKDYKPFTREEAEAFYEEDRFELERKLGIGGKRGRIAYLSSLIQRGIDSEEISMEELKSEYKKLIEEEEKCRYIPGAYFLMAAEGRIKLLPSESDDLNARAWKAKTKEELDMLQDERENHAIQVAEKHGGVLSYVIYGKSHNFFDNIAEWNRENPDKKFSLIEITPESVE